MNPIYTITFEISKNHVISVDAIFPIDNDKINENNYLEQINALNSIWVR